MQDHPHVLAEARVAIVGGGVAGTSLLYHLGVAGWEDVVLLEENELTSGSTWHAAGLCTQLNPSYNLTGLLRYSVELYKTLAADYHECGSVRLATTADRVDEFRHRAATAELLGVPVEIVGPEHVRELQDAAGTQLRPARAGRGVDQAQQLELGLGAHAAGDRAE